MTHKPSGRHLLYLDILGFKDMLRTRSAQEVYLAIDRMLLETAERERGIPDFGTIYFSDTVIFYQKPQGWHSSLFGDVYSLSQMIWTALAAQKIPTRGAIAYGDFHLELDSSGKHTVFFGDALIEAHETQRTNCDWVGITMCPSALVLPMHTEGIEYLFNENVFHLAANGEVLLNPYLHLHSTYMDDVYAGEPMEPLHRWNAPRLAHNVLALNFILRNSEGKYIECTEIEERKKIIARYKYTICMMHKMLGDECFRWAMKAYEQFPEKADEGYGEWIK